MSYYTEPEVRKMGTIEEDKHCYFEEDDHSNSKAKNQAPCCPQPRCACACACACVIKVTHSIRPIPLSCNFF